jgi:hypothetical protein
MGCLYPWKYAYSLDVDQGGSSALLCPPSGVGGCRFAPPCSANWILPFGKHVCTGAIDHGNSYCHASVYAFPRTMNV